MIQVRVAQQSAVSVRIAGAASVRVDVTGTTVVGAPEYSGPYDITPLFSAQVLPTAKRLMQQDLTIKKIPQYEVANDSSGYTLIIGEEYYFYPRSPCGERHRAFFHNLASFWKSYRLAPVMLPRGVGVSKR